MRFRKPFEKLRRGMGVGGWMTNYKRVRFLPEDKAFNLSIGDREHFDRYLTRWDMQNIRSMGMDHIRIPFDQVVVEEYEKPFAYQEDMLRLLDRALGWALDEGFEVILNLHHAIGCYCDFAENASLMDDELLQERFVRLWAMLEDRYHSLDIIFEPLNEVTTQDAGAWNDLAERCVRAIRAKNPTRRIIIGSAAWNSPDRLADLRLFDDDRIAYTFHYYGPHAFTHQRTTINPAQYAYNREIPYPGDSSYYKDFAAFSGGSPAEFDPYPIVGREYVEHGLRGAAEFRKNHPDKTLWFGEFGTIRHARIEWRENWMRDVIRFAIEHDIPYSVWNYLSTPYDCNRFSLVTDDERRIVSREMLRIIQGHVD
ncbi:MAG: cellulase family glycosylhydrolase [Clostridia bacterium]|nr:cellulase family glycosylhydrolase [Clostridia bacterium]MBR4727733.1 cellulase family glycosylhydrolase [Clostridia bacterium]